MRTHSSLEPLEARVAPAGLIVASVVNGVLQLKTVAGQDGDERITISSHPDGTYLLTPDADVTLRVGGTDFTTPQSIGGVTKGLSVNFGAGSDHLTLDEARFTGSLSINLGSGNNQLTLQDSATGGGLLVVTGDGNDTITFAGAAVSVGGLFQTTLGGGTDLVNVNPTNGAFGSVKIDAGSGEDRVRMGEASERFTVPGNLQIIGGAGNQEVFLGEAARAFSVLGALQISLGDGADTIIVAPDLLQLGRASLNVGPGANAVNIGELGGAIEVLKDFKFLAGAGNQTFEILGATATLGPVQFNLADGNHKVFFAPEVVNIQGDLRWTSGAGNASFTLRDSGDNVPTSLTIAGNVLAKMGAGISSFFMGTSALTVGGKVDVRTGDSPEALGQILLGSAFTNIGASVFLKGGANTSVTGIFSGSELHVGGNVTILAGPGSSFLDLTGNDTSTLLGNVVMKMGNPDGNMRVSLRADSFIRGSFTITGGNDLSFDPGMVLGSVKIATAKAGSIDLFGGSRFLRVVDIFMPSVDGANGNISVGEGPAADRPTFFEGGLKIRAGAGNETLRINDTAVFGNTLIDLGGGGDSFQIETLDRPFLTTFRGPVRLLGGAGADDFVLGSDASSSRLLQFLASVIVDGGAGNDSLIIATSTTFGISGDPQVLNVE